MARAAVAPLRRRDGRLHRHQPLRDDRDHALRLLAVRVDEAQADRRTRLWIAGVIVAGVLLRLLVLRSQGFSSDVGTFQAWAERLAQVGPGRFYAPDYFSDYPPGYLYVL